MRQLSNIQARVKKYNNFPKILNSIIKDNEKEILAMNRDQMWEDGVIDVNNPQNILQYQPSTIKQKKRRAKFKRTDHITLKDQGPFHKSLKLKIEPDQFIITSEDPKWKGFLGEGRFKDALGLVPENIDNLKELIADDLIIGFRDAVQNA